MHVDVEPQDRQMNEKCYDQFQIAWFDDSLDALFLRLFPGPRPFRAAAAAPILIILYTPLLLERERERKREREREREREMGGTLRENCGSTRTSVSPESGFAGPLGREPFRTRGSLYSSSSSSSDISTSFSVVGTSLSPGCTGRLRRSF